VVLGFDAESDRAVRGTLSVGETRANANGVAMNLLLPLAIGLGLFSWSRRLGTMIAAAAGVAAIAAGIFLTMSRGSLLAVVVMLCVWLYRYRARPRSLIVVGLLLLLLPAMPDMFFERAQSVFDGSDPTGAKRTIVWQIGVRALQQFGVVGAGLGNFPDAYIQTSYPGFGRYIAGHNTYLSTWVELGAVGLVLLLIVLFGHFRLSRPVKRGGSAGTMAGALEAACCASLAVIFFGDWLWDKTLWMQWILIAWVARTQMGRAPVPSQETAPAPELVARTAVH
jgi:O-antigen ligase